MIDKHVALGWLNVQVRAQKMRNKSLYAPGTENTVVCMCCCSSDMQIATGLKLIADAAEIPYEEQWWDGNVQCNTNYIERSFTYRGIKFFELGTAEKFEMEDASNEKASNEKAEITD